MEEPVLRMLSAERMQSTGSFISAYHHVLVVKLHEAG